MPRISEQQQPGPSFYLGWQYYGVLGSLITMAPLTVGAMLMLLPAAYGKTVEGWYDDDAQGVLQVRGALTESACRLDMGSARQDIWLGEVGTGQLQQVGDQGEPVNVALRLRDCLRSPAGSHDSRLGAWAWAKHEPAVTVSFSAPADVDNPQLVQVRGASGLALRLLDSNGQDIRLGSRGQPLLLTPGQNFLSYTVRAERTAALLVPGAYSATIDFRLNYD
ncbi:type 1 fimbrial protein [Serratia marcescens]|uniref:fimbrial protein n=1 Tax=Serratia marcescens TaxID=615 RepID=UPI001152E235|nr:fimbrial protein [Serratia marcescens]QDI20299.1 type 1 fimbrial protein [Serratia marcescens]QDI30043.1 type 1 fimbrial protein [Serratia marcescens]QDI44547.1 type 1 fimbrial protein [Serratia marcescens]QDI58972.1 type 1 fimbrial protein [Serratia marcescens]QLJ67564.1 fimbrial protein [Serratia marcescens]